MPAQRLASVDQTNRTLIRVLRRAHQQASLISRSAEGLSPAPWRDQWIPYVDKALAQPIVGILGDVIQADFEVQMGAAGETGHADVAEGVTSKHEFPFLHRRCL